MRRDYFVLDVTNVDSRGMPTLTIDFDGPADRLSARLTDRHGEPLSPEEFDVSFRLQETIDSSEVEGVVAITNRITGEYILEVNAAASTVFDFIAAAREYGKGTEEETRYRLVISIDGDEELRAEQSTFLVYDVEGELRRERSLIPSGVEL